MTTVLLLLALSFVLGRYSSFIYFEIKSLFSPRDKDGINRIQNREIDLINQQKEDKELFDYFSKNMFDHINNQLINEFKKTNRYIQDNLSEYYRITDKVIEDNKSLYEKYKKKCKVVKIEETLSPKEYSFFIANIDKLTHFELLSISPRAYMVYDSKIAKYTELGSLELEFKEKYF